MNMNAQEKEARATETGRKRMSQILATAAEFFCDKGFKATSMSDIADVVGMTKAGIYHYVPGGKQDLLFALINQELDSLDNEVIIPARAIADAEKRLRSIIANHTRLIASRNGLNQSNSATIVVSGSRYLTPAQLRKIGRRQRAYLNLLRATLQSLGEEGRLRNIDVTVTAFSLYGMLAGVSKWFRPDGRLSSEQVAEEIARIALGGLLRPQARREIGL